MTRRLLISFILVLFCIPASSQDTTGYEPVLLPISFRWLPGAFGTAWASDLSVINQSDETILGLGRPWCPFVCPGFGLVVRPRDVEVVSLDSPPVARPTQIVFFERAKIDSLFFSLLLYNRDAGTEQPGRLVTTIPVVRSDEFFTDGLSIPRIPVRADYRYRLRIYSLDRAGGPVRLRVFGRYTSTILHEADLVVSSSEDPFFPAYAELSLDGIVDAADAFVFSVEIDSLRDDFPIWALISATSNETQHAVLFHPE